MTARLALVQSQLTSDDLSAVSEQTTLINLYDYSASNIYVGYLKSAYKEAFGVLDKIAVLLNHYLGLGLPEDHCYYRSVWYVHGPDDSPLDPPAIAPAIGLPEDRWVAVHRRPQMQGRSPGACRRVD